MNYRRAKTVFTKELIDIVRDRRTVAAMIIVPLLLYPLILLGGVQAVSGQSALLDDEKIRIGVQKESDWVLLSRLLELDRLILDRSLPGVEGTDEPAQSNIADAPKRSEARLDVGSVAGSGAETGAEGDGDESAAAALIDRLGRPLLCDSLDEAVKQRRVQCGVTFKQAGWLSAKRTVDPVEIEIKYQPENVRSEYAARKLGEAIERVSRWRVGQQLAALHIDERIVRPIEAVETKLTTSGSVLGLILPLVLVLMTITGAIYPAIDLTAGERERGTLESILVCPVPMIDLIVGKFLVVTSIAIFGAALNLASVAATVYFGGIDRALDGSSGGGGFPLEVIPTVLVCLVPFAIFISAIMIAVCSFARTFKEAQNYVTPLIIAVVGLGGFAALPGTQLEGFMLVCPVANMVLLTRELFSGAVVPPSTAIWVLVSTCFYAAAAVAVAAQVFGRETVVFADSVSLVASLRRSAYQPRSLPTMATVGVYTACLFPVWFHLQGWLQLGREDDFDVVLLGTGLLMPVLFLVLPTVLLWFQRVSVRVTVGLRRPGGRYVAAGVLFGLAAWVPVHEIQVAQAGFFGESAGMSDMNESLLAAMRAMSPVLVVLVLAIVPAVCEEWFFRGFVFRTVCGSAGAVGAVLISAAVFAAFHFLVFRFATTFVLGVLLAWLCHRSGSLWPGVVCHGLHNGLLVLMALWPELAETLGQGDGSEIGHLPGRTLAVAGAMVVVGLVLAAIRGRPGSAGPAAVSAGP